MAININPMNKGLLHTKLGVKKGRKISLGKMIKAEDKIKPKKKGGKLSVSALKEKREIVFAKNARKWKH